MPASIATTQPGVTLRFATAGDAPLVMTFVRELAEYEQLAHEVETDAEALAEQLFGEMPAAEVVIAKQSSQPLPVDEPMDFLLLAGFDAIARALEGRSI